MPTSLTATPDPRPAEDLKKDLEKERSRVETDLLHFNQLLDRADHSPERPQGSAGRRTGSPEPMKSPGKYWSISETLDTPEGIKMKINRRRKPNQVRRNT